MDTRKLQTLGNIWNKNGNSRIYFNNLSELYGLKCQYYNSGNICSATFRGEKISNTTAREYSEKFTWCKLWYDTNTNQFGSSGFEKMPKSLAYIQNAIIELTQ